MSFMEIDPVPFANAVCREAQTMAGFAFPPIDPHLHSV